MWQPKKHPRKRRSTTGGWSRSRRRSGAVSTSRPATNSAGISTTRGTSRSRSSSSDTAPSTTSSRSRWVVAGPRRTTSRVTSVYNPTVPIATCVSNPPETGIVTLGQPGIVPVSFVVRIEGLEGPDRAVLALPDSVDRSVSGHDPDGRPSVGFAGRSRRRMWTHGRLLPERAVPQIRSVVADCTDIREYRTDVGDEGCISPFRRMVAKNDEKLPRPMAVPTGGSRERNRDHSEATNCSVSATGRRVVTHRATSRRAVPARPCRDASSTGRRSSP